MFYCNGGHILILRNPILKNFPSCFEVKIRLPLIEISSYSRCFLTDNQRLFLGTCIEIIYFKSTLAYMSWIKKSFWPILSGICNGVHLPCRQNRGVTSTDTWCHQRFSSHQAMQKWEVSIALDFGMGNKQCMLFNMSEYYMSFQ